jgi:hypothetical protein
MNERNKIYEKHRFPFLFLMPIQFLGSSSNSILESKPGFHLFFLGNPKHTTLHSFFQSIQHKIPNSYKMQFPQTIKHKSKENWSIPCQFEYQLLYFPKSIVSVYYYTLESIRCKKNPPSMYEQWSTCVQHFIHHLPNKTHPIYIHMPNEMTEESIESLWCSFMDSMGHGKSIEYYKEHIKSMNLTIVHPDIEKKEILQQHMMYGQIATVRKEMLFSIVL